MSACADNELMLGALVDGELDALNTAIAEAHVLRCEGCRQELERLEAVHGILGMRGVRHVAPDALVERIAAHPELDDRRAGRHLLPGWLAPGVAGALAASLALVTLMPLSAGNLVDGQLVSSHVRSLQPGHLIDIPTSNRHVVKPWFNGRIDFAPPVPELADLGFPLAGGRLDSINGKTMAAIVYHRRLHTVNVFVWRGGEEVSGSETSDGFAVAKWSDGDLRFAAVSDIPEPELRQFEALYRQRSA